MNGAHDLGGTMGLGPILPEPEGEPLFHAPWEARAFAVTIAMGGTGAWNIDESRFAREDRPPADYLAKTYYELWLAGVERLATARGFLAADEIAAGRALHAPVPAPRVLTAENVPAALARGGPCRREALERTGPRPHFAVGDRVRTKPAAKRGHTRLPRYAMGRVGTIERVHGVYVWPDANAHGQGEAPAWTYAVRFDARELWGEDAEAGAEVVIDAFEPYLEPADAPAALDPVSLAP